MAIVGFYFVSGLLRVAGWPRKQGVFRKEVLDTAILDSAIDQMVDWAAALGDLPVFFGPIVIGERR